MAKAIVVGGTASGVGKTTVSAGLAAALVARGHRVQVFKAGPDYIDPSYLGAASGSTCRNLDTWLLPKTAVLELFHRAASQADVAIVEGVMGLFDGQSPDNDAGSTAEVAKLLGAPVVLVADAAKVARSIAATVLGFQAFDPGLDIAGVVLAGVSGDRHLYYLKGPIEQATGIPVLGYMPVRDELRLPERHLGLVPTAETPVGPDFFQTLARQIEATVDVDQLLRLAEDVSPAPQEGQGLFPSEPRKPEVAIAVAQDAAFSFYYQDSLDMLQAWGAEVRPFSPLTDDALPEGVSGVYVGGGFPELFAADLAANTGMKASLRAAAAAGLPVYAECGGLMYLGNSLVDPDGIEHDMAGLVPAVSTMTGARLSIGYRTVRALADGPLLSRGAEVRGHEFHWSQLREEPDSAQAAYKIAEHDGRLEGFHVGSVLASYVHLHLGSAAGLAERFIASCKAWSAESTPSALSGGRVE